MPLALLPYSVIERLAAPLFELRAYIIPLGSTVRLAALSCVEEPAILTVGEILPLAPCGNPKIDEFCSEGDCGTTKIMPEGDNARGPAHDKSVLLPPITFIGTAFPDAPSAKVTISAGFWD